MSRSGIEFSGLFEPRERPAERLGPSPHQAFLEGITLREYELYEACRGRKPVPVQVVARDNGMVEKELHRLLGEIEFRLDRNILVCNPQWACSLVPYAIDLRFFQGKTARAEQYLKMLVATLPGLRLVELEKQELLAFSLEHLGGILLHRDDPPSASKAYQQAAVNFNELINSQTTDIRSLKGFWKEHALRCDLGAVAGKQLMGRLEEARQISDLLWESVRHLDDQSNEAPRSFAFRGHKFRIVRAWIQAARGKIYAALKDRQAAFDAAGEGVGILEEVETKDAPNQLTACLVKRATVRSIFAQHRKALKDLDAAERNADDEEETGVYAALIAKGRAYVYRGLGEEKTARKHAEKATSKANRLGLRRTVRQMANLLASL